ncbi:phage I-like protein [Rhizobium subbaraonis]|uniref:Phage I-like protein n=1 Tax=Rhizobium subbaraonis TaxID=908946 RepID=A0A285UY87_9HYPH|nr:phage protease [Rhizobium subbaraonis]SOC46647.1 phage I-like protein [Rhizobium subbaraonis]
MTNRSFISLHSASDAASSVALCSAVALPDDAADAPEWIHLVPTGQLLSTFDGRGPYRVADAAALARISLQAADGARLVLDENHSTDLAAPKGEPAPARGWITDLQARDDGIWGKVEWTKAGAALMADRAYRHISPVISHRADGLVTAILRASLVNKPNLRGLTALHQEQPMEFLKKLAASLGLPETASEADVLAAVGRRDQTALQSALDPIAAAAGVAAGSDAAAVLAGVQRLKTSTSDGAVITALQSELADLGTKFAALRTSTATEKATAFVDGEIKKGRVGVKPLRDHYIAMHAQDPARVEKEIGALPVIGSASAATAAAPTLDKDGNVTLDDGQRHIAQLMGVDPKAYAETLKAERETAL